MQRILHVLAALCLLALMCLCSACGGGQNKAALSDAQLGLNAQQARGRQVFNAACASCHYAYSSAGSQGPSLKGLLKKRYLPSGLPASDRFVLQTIVSGRGMMPPAGARLSPQQLDDLMAFLHTL